MNMQVITIFPEMFREFMHVGVIGRALAKGMFGMDLVNLRDFASDRHKSVDDRPYGGGAGMVMRADVIVSAIRHCQQKSPRARTIFLTPQGRTLNHSLVCDLGRESDMILISGRYQGIDQRVIQEYADDEISIGDYVLTGGELPAMVLVDAVIRMQEGTVGNQESVESDTFYSELLAPPVYTRPEIWEGKSVPRVLLEGNHEEIRRWRLRKSVEHTLQKREDMALLASEKNEEIRKILIELGGKLKAQT